MWTLKYFAYSAVILMAVNLQVYSKYDQIRRCSETLFQYVNSCYSQCPEGTKEVEFQNVCVETCPSDYPIWYRGKCLPHCPANMQENGNSCVSITETYSYKEIESPALCPENHCKQNYCYRLQCYDVCPLKTVAYNSKCVSRCPADKPYVFNNSCLKNCPESNLFLENSKCVASCSSNKFVSGYNCLNRCPHGESALNRICKSRCPSSHPYSFPYYEDQAMCFDQCPAFSFQNDTKCDLICPFDAPLLLDNKCLSSCPNSHPFMVIRKTQYNQIIACVDRCPVDLLTEDDTCVERCSAGRKLFNESCLNECPESHPLHIYRLNNTMFLQEKLNPLRASILCTSSCTQGSKIFNGICYSECPAPNIYGFNKTCVNKCPSSHSFLDQNECVSSCSRKRDGNICVNDCPMGKLTLNTLCLSECPSSFPFIKLYPAYNYYNKWLHQPPICVEQCPSDLLILKNGCLSRCSETSRQISLLLPSIDVQNKTACLSSCSTNYYGDLCVRKCPNRTVKFNNFCVIECPNQSPYTRYYDSVFDYQQGYNRPKCIEECTDSTFKYKYKCLYECPKDAKFTLFGQCKDSCPPSHPYIYHRHTSPSNYNSRTSTVLECVDQCPTNMVVEGNTCTDACHKENAKYLLFKQCHENCPKSHPKHYSFTKNSKLYHSCVSVCPRGSYEFNNTCEKFCPSHLFGYSDTCLKKCPSSHAYNYTKMINNALAFFCVNNCPVGTFSEGKNCYDQCPHFTVLETKVCVSSCPDTDPFILKPLQDNKYNNTFCLQRCPKHFYSYKNKCVKSCPENFQYIYNETCKHFCPKQNPFTSEKGIKHCLRKCPKDEVNFENYLCVEKCPSNVPFVVNGKCEEQCPTYLKYIEITKHGKKCLDRCYDEDVLNGNICVTKCPMHKLNIEGLCSNVTRCPEKYKMIEVRKQGRTCTNICTDHFQEGNQCVHLCSFGLYIFDNKCRKNCPASHPNEFHEEDTKVFCKDICPPNYVSNFFQCIRESKCSELGKIISEKLCIGECPKGMFLTNNYEIKPSDEHSTEYNGIHYGAFFADICSSTCPENYFKNGSMCTKCDDNFLSIFEDTCVDHCPPNTIKIPSPWKGRASLCEHRTKRILFMFGFYFLAAVFVLCIWLLFCRRSNFVITGEVTKFVQNDDVIDEDNEETCLLTQDVGYRNSNIPPDANDVEQCGNDNVRSNTVDIMIHSEHLMHNSAAGRESCSQSVQINESFDNSICMQQMQSCKDNRSVIENTFSDQSDSDRHRSSSKFYKTENELTNETKQKNLEKFNEREQTREKTIDDSFKVECLNV